MADRWTLVLDIGRPLLSNQVHGRNGNHVSGRRRVWRDAACVLARQARIPALPGITVDAWGRYPDRNTPDPDGIAPAVKGAIDGLVLAQVIPDDRAPYIEHIGYWAPVVDRRLPAALVLVIRPADTVTHPAEEVA